MSEGSSCLIFNGHISNDTLIDCENSPFITDNIFHVFFCNTCNSSPWLIPKTPVSVIISVLRAMMMIRGKLDAFFNSVSEVGKVSAFLEEVGIVGDGVEFSTVACSGADPRSTGDGGCVFVPSVEIIDTRIRATNETTTVIPHPEPEDFETAGKTKGVEGSKAARLCCISKRELHLGQTFTLPCLVRQL